MENNPGNLNYMTFVFLFGEIQHMYPNAKVVDYIGSRCIVSCDERCDKAWGINKRPRITLSEKDDDYAFLPDSLLGIAPIDPGTYEGGWAKPAVKQHRLNKWCVRECERCNKFWPGDNKPFVAKSFDNYVFNMPREIEIPEIVVAATIPIECVWTPHDHMAFVDTQCGHSTLAYGLAKHIGWTYCMFCGGRIVQDKGNGSENDGD